MELQFKKHHPVTLRLWHWLNALAIFGLLGTVILRKTFLSWRTNAGLIQSKATALGVQGLTADGAAEIARTLRDPMWQWHYLLGFLLVGLLLLRLGLGILNTEQSPIRSALRAVTKFRLLPPAGKKGSAHYVFVKVGYAVFYAVVLFMALTGLALYFKTGLGLSKGLIGALKEAHEVAMWFFALFVSGHLVGVVVAELGGEKGLVSDMIHGGDRPQAR